MGAPNYVCAEFGVGRGPILISLYKMSCAPPPIVDVSADESAVGVEVDE